MTSSAFPLSYPSPAAAARECANYLVNSGERDDMIQSLRDNYRCDDDNSLECWIIVVRDWFRSTSHVYCAAFIAQAESEAEIEQEVEAIARELAK